MVYSHTFFCKQTTLCNRIRGDTSQSLKIAESTYIKIPVIISSFIFQNVSAYKSKSEHNGNKTAEQVV